MERDYTIKKGEIRVPEMCRDVNELHPKVKELAIKFLAECKTQGLNVGISETYRTVERQDYLYAQGRTRSGGIVTNSKGSSMQSYHQWRLAFDMFNNVKGQEYNEAILAKAGAIGQKLGLEWGGSWRGFSDSPHLQYTFGLSINDLKSGKKPPNESAITVDENQMQYLATIGTFFKLSIINSPDNWVPKPNMRYAESIISKVGKKLFNTKTYEETINKLVAEKVISSPEIWIEKQYTEEYFKMLIIKIGDYMKRS